MAETGKYLNYNTLLEEVVVLISSVQFEVSPSQEGLPKQTGSSGRRLFSAAPTSSQAGEHHSSSGLLLLHQVRSLQIAHGALELDLVLLTLTKIS